MSAKKRKLNPREQKQRREFLRSIVLTGGLVGASLLGFIPLVKAWQQRLRPPGALAEQAFLAACIKCGQCVQVCPVQAIRLADLDEGFGIGVPFIDARVQACDFSCILGGLSLSIVEISGNCDHRFRYGFSQIGFG